MVHNNMMDGVLSVMFVLVVAAMVVYGVVAIRRAMTSDKPTAHEVDGPAAAVPAGKASHA